MDIISDLDDAFYRYVMNTRKEVQAVYLGTSQYIALLDSIHFYKLCVSQRTKDPGIEYRGAKVFKVCCNDHLAVF